jgi:hypothetical protein
MTRTVLTSPRISAWPLTTSKPEQNEQDALHVIALHVDETSTIQPRRAPPGQSHRHRRGGTTGLIAGSGREG